MTFTLSSNPTQKIEKTSYPHAYVFVLQQYDGTYVIGQGTNCMPRIAAINSGMHPLIPESNTIKRVVAIKEQNETRSFLSVVRYFCAKYGDNRVIAA